MRITMPVGTRGLGALVALLIAVALSAALAPEARAAVRVSSNFAMLPDRNPIHGRDALGFAVNPRNSKHIVAVYADWASLWCEAAVSFNAGRSWRKTRLKAPVGFIWPPCTVGGHLSGQMDGGVAFGGKGRVYAVFSSGLVGENGEPEGQSILVSRSTNGGRSFRPGLVVLRGGEESRDGPDYILPKIAVQDRKGKRDRVYVVAGVGELGHDGVVEERTVMTVSDDGGVRWSPRIDVSPDDQNAIEQSQPVLTDDGTVHVAWRTRGRTDKPGQYKPEGNVVVGTSDDQGKTWRRTVVADVRGYVHEGPPQLPFFRPGAAFTASTFPRLAANPKTGDVYLVYGDGYATEPGRARVADHFIHPDMDVFFHRSGDGGETWTGPRRLNGAPEVGTEITQTRHPMVAVAKGGRVDVVWHDRRHWYRGCTHTHAACQEARLGDTYYRWSEDGGRTWEDERRITDRSINNDVGFDYRFGAYWDFGPVIAPRGKSKALIGWMDSRYGNPDTDSMGIQLARIKHVDRAKTPAGPPRRIAGAVRFRESREEFAIRMSRTAYPGGPEAVLAGTFASRPWSRVVIINRHDLVGALAGGVLARAFLAPVLIAGENGLSDEMKDELVRLAPIGAFMIGGPGSLSPGVHDDLVETGVPAEEIQRIHVPGDEAATVMRIAETMDRRTDEQRKAGEPAFDAAVLVNPQSAHSVAAAVLAANRRLPILLTRSGELPGATAEALDQLDIRKTLIIGPDSAVSDAVAAKVPGPQRLAGSTVAGTSRAVLRESLRWGVPGNLVHAVKPRHRMEAALTGATVGRTGGLLLIGHRARRTVRSMGLADQVDQIFLEPRYVFASP